MTLNNANCYADLKCPEQWPACKRRERPWDRHKDDKKRNAEPYRHGFKFSPVCGFAFGFDRADGNKRNGDEHHGDVFHPEKPDFTHMYRLLKIVQEVIYHRADEIQADTYSQLYMRY